MHKILITCAVNKAEVNRKFLIKLHSEDTICLIVHTSKTSSEQINLLPFVFSYVLK